MTKQIKRLIDGFKPEHYAIELAVDKQAKKFTGKLVVTGFKQQRPSHRLTFHQNGLKISAAKAIKLDKKGDQPVTIDRINNQSKLHEVRLHSKQLLYPGRYQVEIEFSGNVTSTMEGIYLSKFQRKGKEEQIVATQFEAHHAREAFPCIDEPEAKATFELTVISPKGDTVLSNTPIAKQATKGQLTTTVFEKTPIMSTYLLAFSHGLLQGVQKKTKDGVLVGVWASIAQPKANLQYALDEATKMLEFYTDLFGIAYPLPKLDNLALPDFDAGAMENWGLCTYREITLLSDPKNPAISNQQLVSMVVAHELSHQWFGNLVTMKWWDDLWLNESFASLMEHITLDALHPDWTQWEMYVISDVLSTTSRDIYSDIQPISVEITDPDLIDSAFDPTIVYAKGGRLLKMLRDYIGQDAFRDGLRGYFKKHAYSNATRDDLWQAMSAVSQHNIGQLMVPWLTQPGMPVVEITQKDNQLTLKQNHFMLDKPADDSMWPIPLLASTVISPDVLTKRSQDFKLPNSDVVVLNQQASGHYLSHYLQPQQQAFLANGFKSQSLPAETRISLLNDILLLSKKGQAGITEALDIIRHSQDEPRDAVWAQISRVISTASQLSEGNEPIDQRLKELRVSLSEQQYSQLGWVDQPDDDINTIQLRHTLISLMLAGENLQAIDQAKKLYASAKSLEGLPAELRGSILAATVRYGDSKVALDLLAKYPTADPELQADILGGLSATKDNKLARQILAKALGPKGFVRNQDIMRWLVFFIRSQYTREAGWQFMEDNWDWLIEAMSSSKSFSFIPTYCSGVANSDKWAKKYRDFFTPKLTDKILANNIKIGLADVKSRVSWRKREEPKLEKYFS